MDERTVHAARCPTRGRLRSPRRARRAHRTSRATARSAACARASTTPCRSPESRRSIAFMRRFRAALRADMARAMTFRILTLNDISAARARAPAARALRRSAPKSPTRTRSWCALPICTRRRDPGGACAPSGRAGAGVNNIPVEALSRRGIPVFNTPGANANAVKELVLAGLLLAARNIGPAWLFARGLAGDDAAIEREVERGKKQFRRLRAARAHARGRRPRRDRGRGGEFRARAGHEGARLRPADHRAARLAARRRASSRRCRSRTCSHARMPSAVHVPLNAAHRPPGQRRAPGAHAGPARCCSISRAPRSWMMRR